MRSEKITRSSLTHKLIKNLFKRLTLHIVYMASILSLNHACAPQTWLNEAQTHSHLGDWAQALDRYEDSLMSGAHYQKHPAVNTQQIIKGSELSIERLFKQRQKSFIDSLEAPNKVPACLKLEDLIQLYPLAPELDFIQQAYSYRFPSSTLANSELSSLAEEMSQTDRHHQKINDLLIDSEQSIYRLMNQEAFYDQCPWLASNWYLSYRNYDKLRTQLNNLIHHINRSEFTQFETDKSQFKAIKRLAYLVQSFSTMERSFSILFKNEAETLQKKLNDAYASFWRNYSLQELGKEHWGSAWWFKRFSQLPSSLLEAQSLTTSMDQWPVNDKLEKQYELLATSDYLLKSSKGKRNALQVEQRVHNHYKPLYRTKPVYLNIKEGEPQCSLSTQKQSHELRDVAETKQVTAPQYLAALKRVETLQGQLESALSQRESLEKSILSAQTDLEAFDQAQLKQQSQVYRSLVQQEKQLAKELEMKRVQFKQEQDLLSPPTVDDLALLNRLSVEIDALDIKIEEKEMNIEIAKSAWEDSEERLLQRRREVSRLAGYLTKTVIEVEKTSAELDQKEVDLALIPKTKSEKVYSVFRYPLNEHSLSCRITWTVFPEKTQQHIEQTGPPQVLWYAEEALSEMAISHKAYRRYGIKAVSFSKKKLKSKLITKLKRQISTRFERWLNHEQQRQLVVRGQKLMKTFKNDLNLELLAFLSYVSPVHFLDQFYKRLSIELNDPIPFLIQ